MFAEQTCTSPIASPFRGQLREHKCSQVSCLADLAILGHCHFKRMVSEVMEHIIHMSAYFFKIMIFCFFQGGPQCRFKAFVPAESCRESVPILLSEMNDFNGFN